MEKHHVQRGRIRAGGPEPAPPDPTSLSRTGQPEPRKQDRKALRPAPWFPTEGLAVKTPLSQGERPALQAWAQLTSALCTNSPPTPHHSSLPRPLASPPFRACQHHLPKFPWLPHSPEHTGFLSPSERLMAWGQASSHPPSLGLIRSLTGDPSGPGCPTHFSEPSRALSQAGPANSISS